MSLNEMHGHYLEDLAVGMSAVFGKTVSEADIVAFAGVSGDTNPIHLHDGFAKATRFGGRIAHGMLGGSFISTVIGTKCRDQFRSMSRRPNFRAPVKIGDTVTARVEIVDIDAARRRVRLKTECRCGDSVVIDGEAVVMAPRRPLAA
jgi:3-hydroxybutyryl-CoA dehydratase